MPARAANGRFKKSGTSRRTTTRRSGGTTAIVVQQPRSPARRRSSSSSPVVVASRRRRANGGGVGPVKAGLTGAAIGVAVKKFGPTLDKLPKVGGTSLVAAAGLAHLARNRIPEGRNLATGLAYIAGYEVGLSNASKLGVSGDDDF